MIKNKAQKQKLLSPEAYIKEKARQLPIVECYIGKTIIKEEEKYEGNRSCKKNR